MAVCDGHRKGVCVHAFFHLTWNFMNCASILSDYKIESKIPIFEYRWYKLAYLYQWQPTKQNNAPNRILIIARSPSEKWKGNEKVIRSSLCLGHKCRKNDRIVIVNGREAQRVDANESKVKSKQINEWDYLNYSRDASLIKNYINSRKSDYNDDDDNDGKELKWAKERLRSFGLFRLQLNQRKGEQQQQKMRWNWIITFEFFLSAFLNFWNILCRRLSSWRWLARLCRCCRFVSLASLPLQRCATTKTICDHVQFTYTRPMVVKRHDEERNRIGCHSHSKWKRRQQKTVKKICICVWWKTVRR